MKTSELTDLALDWAVATSLGYTGYEFDSVDGKVFRRTPEGFFADFRIEDNSFCYDWSQGGPIIERERISVFEIEGAWRAYSKAGGVYVDGPTPLIAAMRCYVASKLGDEVEIPKGLK